LLDQISQDAMLLPLSSTHTQATVAHQVSAARKATSKVPPMSGVFEIMKADLQLQESHSCRF
jgi:hypothetical protein